MRGGGHTPTLLLGITVNILLLCGNFGGREIGVMIAASFVVPSQIRLSQDSLLFEVFDENRLVSGDVCVCVEFFIADKFVVTILKCSTVNYVLYAHGRSSLWQF